MKMDTNKSSIESRRLIQNQDFLTENSLVQYIEWDALARVFFVNCSFEKVHLVGKVFGSCSFQNCTFNHFTARKAKFSNCHFEDCKLTNSDMTRAEFYDTHFKNCEFLAVDLAASDFDNCKLETTRFFNSNLEFVLVKNVKIWKSKGWIKGNGRRPIHRQAQDINRNIKELYEDLNDPTSLRIIADISSVPSFLQEIVFKNITQGLDSDQLNNINFLF